MTHACTGTEWTPCLQSDHTMVTESLLCALPFAALPGPKQRIVDMHSNPCGLHGALALHSMQQSRACSNADHMHRSCRL